MDLNERIAWAISEVKARGPGKEGHTWVWLGQELGVTKDTVASYAKGEGDFKAIVLERLVSKFFYSPGWLLDGRGEPCIYKDRSVRAEEQPYQPGTADSEGLFGKTKQKEITGTLFSITEFGPKNSGIKGSLGQAVDMLQNVLSSGDQVFIQALMSNLIAFSGAVETSRRQGARIAKLESECEDLKRRLSDLEATIGPPGHTPGPVDSGASSASGGM